MENRKSIKAQILTDLDQLSSEEFPVLYSYILVSGIDYFSQLNSGQLSKKGNAKRYKQFCEKYLELNGKEQEMLYQFRNAVTHTYGQYGMNEKYGNEFRFIFDFELNTWVSQKSRVIHMINPEKLRKRFLYAIEKYEADIKSTPHLQKKYDLVSKKVGFLTSPWSK